MITITTEHIKESLAGLPEPSQVGLEIGYLFANGTALCAVCHSKLTVAGFFVINDGQFIWPQAAHRLTDCTCIGCDKDHATMYREATTETGPSSIEGTICYETS